MYEYMCKKWRLMLLHKKMTLISTPSSSVLLETLVILTDYKKVNINFTEKQNKSVFKIYDNMPKVQNVLL